MRKGIVDVGATAFCAAFRRPCSSRHKHTQVADAQALRMTCRPFDLVAQGLACPSQRHVWCVTLVVGLRTRVWGRIGPSWCPKCLWALEVFAQGRCCPDRALMPTASRWQAACRAYPPTCIVLPALTGNAKIAATGRFVLFLKNNPTLLLPKEVVGTFFGCGNVRRHFLGHRCAEAAFDYFPTVFGTFTEILGNTTFARRKKSQPKAKAKDSKAKDTMSFFG